MIPETLVLGQVLAPIVSALVVIVLYHYIGKEYLGADENAYWNAFRRALLSAGDSTVRQKTDFALTNAALDEELVGRVQLTSSELAHVFEGAGAAQGILSGLKYRPPNVNPNKSNQVEFEAGSMVFRESKSDMLPDALALRQIHVFWFDKGDGTLDVYAHEEYSSLNPLVAWRHYRGVGQDADAGIAKAQAQLNTVGVESQN
jgi:hypothetical protein